MPWFGRFALLVFAIGGFVSAHALVQTGSAMEVPVPTVTVPSLPLPTTTTPTVPSLPAPTVTTPTLPAPTLPAPPPPPPTTTTTAPLPLPPVVTSLTPTLPAPAPQPPRPATTTTPTAGSPAPAAGTATPTPSSPSNGYGSTSPSTGRAAANGSPTGTRSPTRSRALAAETHRTPHRVSVRLAFRLPRSERRFLIVRGPAPSCRVAGYIPVRGHKGVNTVYFAGRVHGRRLDPGVYQISLSPNRRPVPGAAAEFVRVVSPRRSVPLPDDARRPSCATVAATLAGQQPAGTGKQPSGNASADGLPEKPTAQVAGLAVPAPTGDENDDGAAGLPDSGVLGVSTDDIKQKPFLALAVLILVSGLLFAMVALVTRFLRGSWNP